MSVACAICATSGLACERVTPHAALQASSVPPIGSHRLLDLPVASNLPQDVEIFVGVSPTEELSRHLDWDALLDAHPALSSRWSKTVEAKLGRSLLHVADLSAVGIDTARPFGFALLEPDRDIACLFVKIDDQVSLDAWLRELALHHGVELLVETEGLATIVWTPALPEVVMVRRGGWLFVVFGDASPARLHEQARRVALVTTERSLASVTAFRALAREVGRGALVATYVRSAALAQKWLGIWDRQADPIFGSFSGAAVGLWSAGDHLRLEGFLALRPESLVDRGLGLPTSPSELHGLRERSVVVTASLRPELLGELLRAGYGATGDPAQARVVLEEKLQLDLETEVIGHSDGRLALISSRSDATANPRLTTSVAASLLPGHEPARILEAWQTRALARDSAGLPSMAPYGLSNQIVWSHGPEPIAAHETSVRGDEPLERALVTVRHRPTVLAMTAHTSVWPVLASERPNPTWDALCEPLGVAAVRADRSEGGLSLKGALFLRVPSLARYAERVMLRLERSF